MCNDLYEVGEIVYVTTYYNDLIPSGGFLGLVTEIEDLSLGGPQQDASSSTKIYKILNLKTNSIETAEGFALCKTSALEQK